MPDSSKSLSDRLKEGVFDFCERMADVEAGRRNQYVGISQQMHDAEDERRRLRKKAKEENEQGRQRKLNDDAGGDENRGEKDTQELGERWKTGQTTNDREVQNEKTAEDNLRKDKAVDKGAAHGIGKLQEQQISESSSDEELQWATDRMMMGDLDEVPVEIEQSKKKMPNSSNATKDPPLRLRGGAGGAGRWHKLEDLMNNDYIKKYPNALREEARGFASDRSQYKEKHVHFDESAQEPHRNLSFRENPRAGHSRRYDFGTSARAPTFSGQSSRGERHQHGGRNGLGFGQSSSEHRGRQRTGFGFSEDVNFREWYSSKDNGGKRRTGVEYSNSDLSDEEEWDSDSDLGSDSDSRRSSHNKGKDKNRRSSSKHSGGRRGTGFEFSNEDLSDEEESDSDFIRSSHKKGKDKSRGGYRTRSQFDDEDADDADEYWKRSSKSAKAANESSSHKKGKDKSRGGNRTRSQFDDEDADDADEYWKRSSKSAKAANENSSHNKGKDKSRGGNRTRSQFDDEDADDADEYWKRFSKSAKAANESSSHNKGKDKSRGGNRPRSQFDDEDADDADENWKRSSKSAKAAKAPPPPPPPDHYGVLGLTRYCSAQEVTEASKRMRIQTHPDRLKKEHMSAEEKAKIDETAANVGFAAEVLSDPELREEHDRLVRRWERKYSPY